MLRASDPETYFLLADTLRDDHLSQEPAPTLLDDFARLLGTRLDTLAPTPTETLPLGWLKNDTGLDSRGGTAVI